MVLIVMVENLLWWGYIENMLITPIGVSYYTQVTPKIVHRAIHLYLLLPRSAESIVVFHFAHVRTNYISG